MEWKVHFVLLPLQAAYRFQCGMKKKKRINEIQIFLVYTSGNSLAKAEQ